MTTTEYEQALSNLEIAVKEKLSEGTKGDDIKKALLDKGWQEKDVDNILKKLTHKKGLQTVIKELSEKVDMIVDPKKAKEKRWRPKFSVRKQLKSLATKNKILVNLLGTNRNAKLITAKIQDGFIVIDGKYHACSTDFVYLMDGKFPMIVLPEWSLLPIGTKDYYDALDKNTAGVEAQKIIIRAMEHAATVAHKPLGKKAIIWIIVGGVAVIYILFGGGGK